MSTGRYATIKLNPFLQQFLRGYFNCHDIVFSFPKGSRKNWLPFALEKALWYPPPDFKPRKFGTYTFYIEIPDMNAKDPDSMNYVSQTANNEFVKQIEKFYFNFWYDFIEEHRLAGYGPKAIINLFMDRYCIAPEYTERLKRDYTRYRNWKNQQKFRKKISISS